MTSFILAAGFMTESVFNQKMLFFRETTLADGITLVEATLALEIIKVTQAIKIGEVTDNKLLLICTH